jgi:hypothetical protein
MRHSCSAFYQTDDARRTEITAGSHISLGETTPRCFSASSAGTGRARLAPVT